MPIEFDNTIKLRDIVFMVIFIVLAYFVMEYDIKRANECIEMYNNFTRLMINYNKSIIDETFNITDLIKNV